MRRILMAACVSMLAVGAAFAETPRMISVQGHASIDVVPDMATITIGVTQEAKEATAALAAASQAVDAILGRMIDEGIQVRDMQTRGLSLQPVWANRRAQDGTPAEITGFVARNSIVVRVRDLARLGRILDQSVQDGANTFDGLQFGVLDPAPLEAEARKAAVKDAMKRAAELAEAAGVTLGAVQSVTESGTSARPMPMEMSAARSMDVPIAAGEVSVSGHVAMVFAIGD